jgi:hypothetical protein
MKSICKYAAALAAVAIVSVGQVRAAVSFDLYIAGMTPTPDGSTAVLIVDSAGNGFGDFTFAANPVLSETMWSPELDDIVVGIFEIGSSETGIITGNTGDFALAGQLSPGDQMMILWYPTLPFSPLLTGPGQGRQFGFYRDNLGDPLNQFVLPADGIAGTIYREVGVGGYPNASSGGTVANQYTAVVPEPSTVVLVGLSVLGIVGGLRRRK